MNNIYFKQNNLIPLKNTNCTRILVVIMGLLIGLSGIIHGVFETFQGNKPTGGFLLESIGAFTIIPNYLFTGIAAIIVGLLCQLHSVSFLHAPDGVWQYMRR